MKKNWKRRRSIWKIIEKLIDFAMMVIIAGTLMYIAYMGR